MNVDPTIEDVDAFTFRILRQTGSVCCDAHRAIMIAMILYGDENDAETFYAGVRSCTSMRWADLPVGDWLRERATAMMEREVSVDLFFDDLKKRLDF